MTSTSSQEHKTGGCADKAGSCGTESKKEAVKTSDECCGGGSCGSETKTAEKKTGGCH